MRSPALDVRKFGRPYFIEEASSDGRQLLRNSVLVERCVGIRLGGLRDLNGVRVRHMLTDLRFILQPV